MGNGSVGTLSVNPNELNERAKTAEDCAMQSVKLAAEHAAEGISGKIRGGEASSTVKVTAEYLTEKLKSIEVALGEYSDNLLQLVRDVEQTDRAEAGEYGGLATFSGSEGLSGNGGADASMLGGVGGKNGMLSPGASGSPSALATGESQQAANGTLARIRELMGAGPAEG